MEPNKPFLVVFVIHVIYAGYFMLSKAAFNVGMNCFIFTFYRQAIATIFLTPFALYFGWKNAPPLSFKIFLQIFMMSLFGITLSLDLYGIGLSDTSASMGSATTNCLPVTTFFLAVILRLEMWKIKTGPGIAKLVGVVICLGGAITLALYKGPSINILGHHHLLGPAHPTASPSQLGHQARPSVAWIKGSIFLLSGNTFWALWLVIQAKIMKGYPSKLMFTTLSCLLSSFQSFVIAIAFEQRPSQWLLGWNVRLLAVSYCGIVVTGVAYYLQAYVIEKKGPVFLALWTPLGLILTMFCSVFLLGEIITLGSIIGGILLVGGLYCVLWAKSKEQRISPASCTPTPAQSNKEALYDFKSIELLKNPTSLGV